MERQPADSGGGQSETSWNSATVPRCGVWAGGKERCHIWCGIGQPRLGQQPSVRTSLPGLALRSGSDPFPQSNPSAQHTGACPALTFSTWIVPTGYPQLFSSNCGMWCPAPGDAQREQFFQPGPTLGPQPETGLEAASNWPEARPSMGALTHSTHWQMVG